MDSTPYEARIVLALKALESSPKLSIRAAAKIYNVSNTTLQARRVGRLPRREIPANSRKLTNLEEQMIVQFIIDLVTRAFPLDYAM